MTAVCIFLNVIFNTSMMNYCATSMLVALLYQSLLHLFFFNFTLIQMKPFHHKSHLNA